MLQENPDDRPNIEQVKKRVEELRISPPTKKKVCNKLSFVEVRLLNAMWNLWLLILLSFLSTAQVLGVVLVLVKPFHGSDARVYHNIHM